MGFAEYEAWKAWAKPKRRKWAGRYNQATIDTLARNGKNDAHLHWLEVGEPTLPPARRSRRRGAS